MVAFLIRRTFGMIIVLIAVSFVTYIIFFKIPGGDPATRIAGATGLATSCSRAWFIGCSGTDQATCSRGIGCSLAAT